MQRRRDRGWRLPAGTSYVGRPTVFGNPFTVGTVLREGRAHSEAEARRQVIQAYREWLTDPHSLWWPTPEGQERRDTVLSLIPQLAGRSLACWCPPGPCHADVLLAMANPPPITMETITTIIGGHRFRHTSEASLQRGIHAALTSYGLPARREVRLSNSDIIDFMVGAIGIETKVAGALRDVVGQLSRYARHPEVTELLLVTTRAGHRAVPPTLETTPVRTLWLSGLIG